MPDDKTIPSSAAEPEGDEGKSRPTVISPPEGRVRAPARFGAATGAAGPLKPTVIEARSRAADPGRPPQAEPRPPKAPVATAPTAVPGVERKRLTVDIVALGKLWPHATPGVLKRALRLLQPVVVETLNDRSAVLWGHRLQQDYSQLVSETLALSQADVLKRVTGYITRMTDILGSIDLEAVCGAGPSAGMLGQYLKRVNKRIDTVDELDTARLELDQLVRLTGDALEKLLALKETLEKHAKRTEEMGDEVEASALAAEFLSVYLRDSRNGVAQRFLERSMSLTQTVAQIRGGASLRGAQIDQPLRLIAAIQNVALVILPGWLGSIAALTGMLQSKKTLTLTEAGELSHQLGSILQQLKA